MLFHYHIWTPHLEETEAWYTARGFHVSQRIGKKDGEFSSFNPPLSWDDFRTDKILFRIIEMKRGAVNVTIGFGKTVRFDHIGFLIQSDDVQAILDRAATASFSVQANERRTFLQTPYGLRIELQTHEDAIADAGGTELVRLVLATPREGLEADLAKLFDQPVPQIQTVHGEKTVLQEAVFSYASLVGTDPNGVQLVCS
ncbi:hypothetical protein ACRPK8_12240 [Exiguobacterium sp. TDN 0502]|uniref:hypothetical protein n=1 Tax=Exiguobacterium sp. TDN 0502 TaxID=3420731 RepID=UPI003D777F58